jgi:hypothetical protein
LLGGVYEGGEGGGVLQLSDAPRTDVSKGGGGMTPHAGHLNVSKKNEKM